MKLVWTSDLHLDIASKNNLGGWAADENDWDSKEFGKQISPLGDILVITGDTAEHSTFEYHLSELAEGFSKPVYFVLGNHCFYGASFLTARKLACKVSKNISNLHYLPNESLVLNNDSILLGSDGWYDCRVGDPYRLDMNDFTAIADFNRKGIDEIIRISKQEADTLASQADIKIRNACKKYKNIYFATHVPPFPDVENKNDIWDPWFVHISMGNKLADIAMDFPDNSFTILAGHRHKPYIYKASHNMVMFVAAAKYCFPSVYKVIEL